MTHLSQASERPFPCNCGGKFYEVMDSRVSGSDKVRRRRKCDGFNERITTYEMTYPEMAEMFGKQLEEMKKKIQEAIE